jgi:cell wall assembly regulator SMI1
MSDRSRDQRVELAWQEIVAWCRVHAPVTAAALRPAAGDQAILDAERSTGVVWPSELRCWYRMHDGVKWADYDGHFFPSSFPLTLQSVVATHRLLLEVWSENIDLAGGATMDELMAEPAGESTFIFIPAYIPIASDAGTETLVMDARAGEFSGAVRGFDKVEADKGPFYWTSLCEALGDILAALTHGQKTKNSGWFAKVEDGRLDWDF